MAGSERGPRSARTGEEEREKRLSMSREARERRQMLERGFREMRQAMVCDVRAERRQEAAVDRSAGTNIYAKWRDASSVSDFVEASLSLWHLYTGQVADVLDVCDSHPSLDSSVSPRLVDDVAVVAHELGLFTLATDGDERQKEAWRMFENAVSHARETGSPNSESLYVLVCAMRGFDRDSFAVSVPHFLTEGASSPVLVRDSLTTGLYALTEIPELDTSSSYMNGDTLEAALDVLAAEGGVSRGASDALLARDVLAYATRDVESTVLLSRDARTMNEFLCDDLSQVVLDELSRESSQGTLNASSRAALVRLRCDLSREALAKLTSVVSGMVDSRASKKVGLRAEESFIAATENVPSDMSGLSSTHADAVLARVPRVAELVDLVRSTDAVSASSVLGIALPPSWQAAVNLDGGDVSRATTLALDTRAYARLALDALRPRGDRAVDQAVGDAVTRFYESRWNLALALAAKEAAHAGDLGSSVAWDDVEDGVRRAWETTPASLRDNVRFGTTFPEIDETLTRLRDQHADGIVRMAWMAFGTDEARCSFVQPSLTDRERRVLVDEAHLRDLQSCLRAAIACPDDAELVRASASAVDRDAVASRMSQVEGRVRLQPTGPEEGAEPDASFTM